MIKLVHHSGNPEAKDFILSWIRLSDIHTDHPGVTEYTLSKVRSLHLKTTATSKLQAVMNTMHELRAYPKEYAKAIQHIDHIQKQLGRTKSGHVYEDAMAREQAPATTPEAHSHPD